MARKTESAKAIDAIKKAAVENDLVVVFGTGVSIALTNNSHPELSWVGAIKHGLDYAQQRGKISKKQESNWLKHLESDDIDDLLGAAEFLTKKLSSTDNTLYEQWFKDVFQDVEPENPDLEDALQLIKNADISIATLNYDDLLEKTTKLPSICHSDQRKALSWAQRNEKGILHLHGVWDKPEHCVLSITDYESTHSSEFRKFIQQNLSGTNRLLFIGCGDTFSDPNFTNLVKWFREIVGAGGFQHYALVPDREVDARKADENWQGFVEPLSYGADHSNLAGFLKGLFSALPQQKTSKPKQPKSKDVDQEVLNHYRNFLIRDCGQMTIEGVGGGNDVGDRRFDLEKLFVPLQAVAIPPEISKNDPDRDAQLEAWHAENNEPKEFGQLLSEEKRIALLALPGGGKTLLLKRLVAAYADPTRRKNAEDNLPDLDVMPFLIRCRDWKGYIEKPIKTMMRQMVEITGEEKLTGLFESIEPMLKQGKIILLVDGLDEIHDDGERTQFAENLEIFLNEYKDVRVVVTSREAGFDLVAKPVGRVCSKWRIAGLNEDAVRLLCTHWHLLMDNNKVEAGKEANVLADRLLENRSLTSLTENPLLLTMLLVVKQGAGTLPTNRTALYYRAAEVLLNTWNIKGHKALSLDESLPQLAFVAFELSQMGEQVVTASTLVRLIGDSRDIKHIARHAKGTPDEFLKRVELRSSLLVQSGYRVEGGKTVPTYQFRHLTFQEYLTAYAIANEYNRDFKDGDTVLTPLKDKLESDEWKEIVPMTAVMAQGRAEPLIAELVKLVQQEFDSSERDEFGRLVTIDMPIQNLVGCLADGVRASQSTLNQAFSLIPNYFVALRRLGGPLFSQIVASLYQDELIASAMKLYFQKIDFDLDFAHGIILFFKEKNDVVPSEEIDQFIIDNIYSLDDENRICALFCLLPICLSAPDHESSLLNNNGEKIYEFFVESIEHSNFQIYELGLWGLMKYYDNFETRLPEHKLLNKLLDLTLLEYNINSRLRRVWENIPIMERDYWVANISEEKLEEFRLKFSNAKDILVSNRALIGIARMLFHTPDGLPADVEELCQKAMGASHGVFPARDHEIFAQMMEKHAEFKAMKKSNS